MYTGHSSFPAPLPVPVPAWPTTATVSSPVVAGPRTTPSSVPVPVPVASFTPHTAAVPSSSPAPSPYVPVAVPRPVASPTPFVPHVTALASLSVPIPQPIKSFTSISSEAPIISTVSSFASTAVAPPPVPFKAVSTVSSSSSFSSSSSSSTTATPTDMPLPVGAAAPSSNASAPRLHTTTSSPPPSASVFTPTPLLPLGGSRPSTTKTVTFSLPGETVQRPASGPPVPIPLPSALHTPTPAVTTPVVPVLDGPGSFKAAMTAAPAVAHLYPPVVAPPVGLALPSAAASPSAVRAPTSATVIPVVLTPPIPTPVSVTAGPEATTAALGSVAPTVSNDSAHYTSSAAVSTATAPVVPALSHGSGPLTTAAQLSHVPTLPKSASLSIPSLSIPVLPPAQPISSASATTTAAVPAGSSLPSSRQMLGAFPTMQPISVPTLTVPVSYSDSVASPLPVLHTTEEEAPTTLPVLKENVELAIPDYSKWLFPAIPRSAAPATPVMKFPLAEMKVPQLLSVPELLRWSEAEVLASLPMTLPPEYVIFGGARYSGAPLDLVRPPLVPKVAAKQTNAFYEAAEAQRLQFLLDQLDVAKTYLKIEARQMASVRAAGGASSPPQVESALPTAPHGTVDVLTKPGEEEDLGKATIWTTAYFGTPQQLYRVLKTKHFDSMLSSAGHVQYQRRRWGLKRAGETFVLGFGMKATALQFAAAAGKLDSVVVLLTNGAKDNTFPLLKEILSKESMTMIASICGPRARPTRVQRPVIVDEDLSAHDTHSGMMSAFVSEQVTGIHDASYAQPYAAAFF